MTSSMHALAFPPGAQWVRCANGGFTRWLTPPLLLTLGPGAYMFAGSSYKIRRRLLALPGVELVHAEAQFYELRVTAAAMPAVAKIVKPRTSRGR